MLDVIKVKRDDLRHIALDTSLIRS